MMKSYVDNTKHMSQVAIYARKSSESEDRQVLSIDSQVNELKAFAEKEGYTVSQVFTESKSAKAPGRPVFNELFRKVQRGQFESVLCWKLDRLARNPVDGGAVIWAMEEKKLSQIITPQRAFVNTGNDKFWMQLEFGMAKKYVDDLSDNVKRGQRAKVELGWQVGRVPLGYMNDLVKKTVIQDPERFDLVRELWTLMLTGNYSVKAITHIATEQFGLRTRQLRHTGGNPVAFSTLYGVFRNPFYYGAFTHNNTMHEGSHTPMVTKSQFDRVQYLLGRRSKPRPQKHVFAYTGQIKCGECGCAITAEHKINRQGHEYDYYHCTRRKRTVRCSQRSVEVRELDRQIAAFLDTITITKDLSDWCSYILKELNRENEGKDELTAHAQWQRLESCKKELDELLTCKIRKLISEEEFSRKRESLIQEKYRLKELVDDRDSHFDEVFEFGTQAFQFAEAARRTFAHGSVDEKRQILKYTGSNLVLSDGKLSIEPKKPLLFIQKALETAVGKQFMFEPQKIGYGKIKSSSITSTASVWRDVVEDVRTFFVESLRFPHAPNSD